MSPHPPHAEIDRRGDTAGLHRTAYEITESIPVGTYTMVLPPGDGMGRFSFMSTRFLELTGLDRETVVADPFQAFACVHPDDRAEWVRKNAEVFAAKTPFFGECRIIVRGEVRWITAESSPRDLPDGSTVWEGVLIDVTDRKRAEAALVSANRNMRLAAEAAGLGFWEYDVATGIDTWDDRMLAIHGVSREAFDGRWDSFLHPDDRDRVMRATEAILGAETAFALDYRIVRPNGAIRHVHQHGTVIRDAAAGAVRVAGVLEDVTETVAAEERRRESEAAHRRELEEKLRASLAAAAIAHEIEQPLATILLQAKMARRDGQATGSLEVVAAEAARVVTTIDHMKMLLRSVQTEHVAVDLGLVVQTAILAADEAVQAAGAVLTTAGLDRPAMMSGDAVQLQIAVGNLLRNAVEAVCEADSGGRRIAVEVVESPDAVEVVVGDSGPGFTGPMRAIRPLTTTKPGGTGVGLFVVRTVVENHGGSVAFGTSPLGGAEVRCRLSRGAPTVTGHG
ncbi:MAG: PAS domain-containing protein [Planctomycetaceae bacterium]